MPGNQRLRNKSGLSLSTRRKKNKGKNLKNWRNKSIERISYQIEKPAITPDTLDCTGTSLASINHGHISQTCKNIQSDKCTLQEPSPIEPLPGPSHLISSTPNHPMDTNNELGDFTDGGNSNWMSGSSHLENNSQDSESLGVTSNSTVQKPNMIAGRRIVNIGHFISAIQNLQVHSPFDCTFSDMTLTNEKQFGMIHELTFVCKMCNKKEKITTDVIEGRFQNVNTAVVTAMTNIGQGYSQLEELCCSLDIPCMAKKTFTRHKALVDIAIHDSSWESMEAAAKQEAEFAIAEGSVCKTTGIPEITVVVDGAWSKRSYRTNYNAHSGVACILGQKTKKVLFIGVRNSYCCICARAEAKKETPNAHLCYKNWTRSSTAMEADIIVEGFKKSIQMYNLKYTKVIGDGDSSVMSKLCESQPYGNTTQIMKVECTNHLLRNYVKKIREVGGKKRSAVGPVPGELRNRVTNSVMRLRYAVTGAVKHHLENNSKKEIHKRVNLLQRDIVNGPSHVFGDHEKCSIYFCKGKKNGEPNVVEELKKYGLWQEIMAANSYLSRFTYSLLQNVTSNIAESYNAKICKYVAGKRVNLIQRQTYGVRSELSALSANVDEEANRLIHKKLFGVSPGINSKILSERRKKRKKNIRKKCLFPPQKKPRLTYQADADYGDLECALDMEKEVMDENKIKFIENLALDEQGRKKLEENSRGQSHCELWKFERKKRLTASNFGKICKMKEQTSCQKLVKSILYSEFSGTASTVYGLEKEKIAIQALESLIGVVVEECGLFVDKNLSYLAASPDGIIDGKGLVEVKCPASARHLTPIDAVKNKIIKYCIIDGDGRLKLKTNHNYYYQVQGQLHISEKNYCLFVVWTPNGIEVEKITRDDDFWYSKMEPKLKTFYIDCLLPEIIDPRYPRQLPIRERTNN